MLVIRPHRYACVPYDLLSHEERRGTNMDSQRIVRGTILVTETARAVEGFIVEAGMSLGTPTEGYRRHKPPYRRARHVEATLRP
jgi:hypothetical protein